MISCYAQSQKLLSVHVRIHYMDVLQKPKYFPVCFMETKQNNYVQKPKLFFNHISKIGHILFLAEAAVDFVLTDFNM